MRKMMLSISLVVVSVALLASSAFADRLLIERVRESQSFPMPKRGATMDQVRQQFGEPMTVTGPVGKPPITTWKYHDISVYFEKRWVIDSVVNKVSPTEKVQDN
jgi:hypothetical protein